MTSAGTVLADSEGAPPREGSDSALAGWKRRRDVLVVLALLVLAAVLRAPPLGPDSLWLDDAWPALVSRADGPADVRLVGLTAPGFVAVLGALMALLGPGAVVAQAVPFLCGVLAPPGVYLVARMARVGRAAALLGAGVLLTAPVHLTYSTRVKQYTLEVVLALALSAATLLVVREPDRGRSWQVLFWLGVLGTVASSVVAIPVVAALAASGLAALGLLVARDPRGPRAVRLAVGTGLAWSLLAAGWWVTMVGPATNASLSGYWAEYFSVRGAPGVLSGLLPLPVLVSGAAFACCTLLVLRRDRVLAVLLLTPPVLAVGLAVARLAPLGGGRTDLYLYASLALVIAVGADETLRLLRTRAQRGVSELALVAVALGLIVLTPGPDPYPREDVRPLVAEIDAGARPGDLVLVYSATRWAHALYTRWPVDLVPSGASANGFDASAEAPAGVRLVVLPPQRETPRGHREVVRAALGDAARVWLVTSHTSPDVGVVTETLSAEGLVPSRVDARPGAELTVWTRPPRAG